MKRIREICLLLSAVLLMGGCGLQPKASEDWVIASANPMTGNSSGFGDVKVKGMELAIEEINKAGGVQGRKIRLIVGDDASSPKTAFTLAQKLAADPSVMAVVGHWNSSCTLAARNVYNGAGIPVITDSVNKAITDGTTPFLFRISLTDTSQARQLAQYAYDRQGFRRAAIVYTNNDFGKGLREDFRERFQSLGGEINAMEIFFQGQTTDFSAELEKIRDSGADFIFMAGYYEETALIAKQSKALGIKLPILGTEGISSGDLINLAGTAAEGIRFAGFFHPGQEGQQNKAFVASFRQRYGLEPDSYAALAYDSVKLLAEAAEKGGTTRQAVYQYLQNVKDYPGVTGAIGFDARHDAGRRIIILTIQNGRIVPDAVQP